MSQEIMKTAEAVRSEEKEDLKRLNDRLALYVQTVRQLGSKSEVSATFLSSFKSVQEEVRSLKVLYEAELNTVRQQLDAANREKNNGNAECAKMQRAAAELEDRYRVEVSKNSQYLCDIQQLQQRIYALEQEVACARAADQVPKAQLAATQDALAKAEAKSQDLVAGIEMERARVKQLQDKIASLEQQQVFSVQVHNEELRDTKGRLEQSANVICKLEARVQEVESRDPSLPELMEKMRQKTELELKTYKHEMEAAHGRDTAAMKQQLANQQREMEQWRLIRGQLQTDNDNLMAKVRSLEGQVIDFRSQKAALEEQIKVEKTKGAKQIHVLEQKLKELQDLFFARMAEMNASREIQVSLRAEIETMRVLLEEEERRMRASSSRMSVTNAPSLVEYGVTSRSSEFHSQLRNTNLHKQSWKTGKDGFPTITTDNKCKGGWTTGSTKLYVCRSADIRGSGTCANSQNGRIHHALPRVQ